MPSTFLDLCNQTLRRLNEVQIAEADFSLTRGVQSLVKDAVIASIRKINQSEFEWPFNAAEETDVLTPGQSEYVWPSSFKVVEWDSFQIQSDGNLGVGFRSLQFIDRSVWYTRHRDQDRDAGAAGRGIPQSVFPSHGSGYGVTPAPDKPYTVRFRYFQNVVTLVNANDETRVPSDFDSLIVDGALYHMYMFKDNAESASLSFAAFERGLKDLRTLFINNYNSVYDRRVNFGGGRSNGGNLPLVGN